MCNFLLVASRFDQLSETEGPVGRDVDVAVVLFPTQPPNWAWGTSRQNWTASPAERRTQSCPTPTRHPMARTHEGNSGRSLLFFFSSSPLLPPPLQSSSMSLALPPSALCLRAITKMQGENEGCRGGGGGHRSTRFCLHVIPELTVSSPTPLFLLLPLLRSFSTWLLRPRGLFFSTVTHETVCYVSRRALPRGVEDRMKRASHKERKRVISIHFM